MQLVISAARKHRPEELCRQLLAGVSDCLWAAADYRPERADFVQLWRSDCGCRPLPRDLDGLLSLCPPGMAPESFCICLLTFLETGLLQGEQGRLYGAKRTKIDGKADLESTEIMRRLRAFQF